MLLNDLVAASTGVAATRSRNKKRDLLAAAISAMSERELAAGVSYLSGEVPQGRIGLGYAAVHGTTAHPAGTPTLMITDVAATLDAISTASGAGSKGARNELLAGLLGRATDVEQVFIRKLLLRELRQGALEGVMAEAIAIANNIPVDAVRRAAMVGGDLPLVAVAARRGIGELDAFQLQVGRPVQPMLAQSATDAAEALGRHPHAIVETKYDGARVQVHKDGAAIRIFTRRLREVTTDLPDVATAAAAVRSDQAILDGEAIGIDAAGRPLPFQETMSRFGSGGPSEAKLDVVFFDVLLLDGQDMITRPAQERWDRLVTIVPDAMLPRHALVSTVGEANLLLEQAVAGGHEGIMIKAPDAEYAAGRRGSAWLKVKPVHTLDLVVLAVEWGSGRRRGRLSNLHLGARDPETGGFVMLGKTFKGLTDQMLGWQTARFLGLETHRERHVVFVRPEQVVEVAFDGVQQSSRYPGGLALRFARVKGYREDKSAMDADTIGRVRELFDRSRGTPTISSDLTDT